MKLTEKYISNLDRDKNHILVCKTAVALPFSFIAHSYLVTVRSGVVSRYDVTHHAKQQGDTRSYVHKNYYDAWEGILRFYRNKGKGAGVRSESKIIRQISDVDEQVIKDLEEQYMMYPYSEKYMFWGPNCNTFTSWILQNIDIDVSLPWNALGKNYRAK